MKDFILKIPKYISLLDSNSNYFDMASLSYHFTNEHFNIILLEILFDWGFIDRKYLTYKIFLHKENNSLA